jgi:hypothetical protein
MLCAASTAVRSYSTVSGNSFAAWRIKRTTQVTAISRVTTAGTFSDHANGLEVPPPDNRSGAAVTQIAKLESPVVGRQELSTHHSAYLVLWSYGGTENDI